MVLGRHQSENIGGICRILIFKLCDIDKIDITTIDQDTVSFVPNDDVMDEITPDNGIYSEPGQIDNNGTSYNTQIVFTIAKDRIAQRQLVNKLFNRPLGAFVLNNNGDWKYFQNLTLLSNLNSARNKTNLNNKSYTLFTTTTEQSLFALEDEAALIINTTWNEASDGAFTPSITSSLTGRYVFDNGLEVVGNSISATGTGLDGSLQKVRFIIEDFNTISTINFINLKINGVADLSLITFSIGSVVLFTNNPSLTDLKFSETDNVINLLDIELCNITGVFDLSNVRLNGSFVFRQNPQLDEIIHSSLPSSQNTITSQYRGFSCNVGSITFNDFIFAPSASVILLQNNNMSVAEIDQILANIDAVAPSGTALIQLDGSNASPTGGITNPNVVSLVSKGYTVQIN